MGLKTQYLAEVHRKLHSHKKKSLRLFEDYKLATSFIPINLKKTLKTQSLLNMLTKQLSNSKRFNLFFNLRL